MDNYGFPLSSAQTQQLENNSSPLVIGGEDEHAADDWKSQPPYLIQRDFPQLYSAECHCGRIKYQLSRAAPLSSKLCHCVDCQVQHGAPFQWAAIFHKTDINFVNGWRGLEWYDPSTQTMQHTLPCKVRCAHCHSPVMDEGRNMILLFPSLVSLQTEDQRRLWKPKCHIFYGQRYLDVNDGLPKWTGLNDQSNLIADSPPEMIRELEFKQMQ